MQNIWVVRAGTDNEAIDDFQSKNVVGYGGPKMGDLRLLPTREAVMARVKAVYESNVGAMRNWAGQHWRISRDIGVGDLVLTPVQASREVLIGEVKSDYEFRPDLIPNYPQIRHVSWMKKVPRSAFPDATRNAMGSTLSVFSLNPHREVILAIVAGEAPTIAQIEQVEEADVGEEDLFGSTKAKAAEIIADQIHAMEAYRFQEFVAAVLRATGLRAVVGPRGSDGGVDIRAYPDALGLGSPRIKAQVKHRKGSTSAPEMREFLATLGEGEVGLYVSTGGFTKDALAEPERRGKHVRTMDSAQFIDWMLEFYERLEPVHQRSIPLQRVYIPVDEEESPAE